MAKKVIKAPPEWKKFSLGYRHWEADENGIVHDLSPDDKQFLELQRLFKLEIIDAPTDASVETKPSKREEAEVVKPQENKEE